MLERDLVRQLVRDALRNGHVLGESAVPPEQERLAELETRAVLKALIEARAALAELKATSALIPEPSVLINAIPLLEAQASSEIENIVGVEDGVGSDVIAHAYSAQQVVEAAQASGIDLIAPQLGTAHGVYHGRPKLLPERAREFRALSDKPIVLHGGTGLTTQEFQAFIEAGVSKINISTELKMTYMKSALASLRRCEQTQEWDPPTLFNEIGGAVETMAVDAADPKAVEALLARLAAETLGLVAQIIVVFEAGLNEQGGVAALAVMVSLVTCRAHGVRKIGRIGGRGESVAKERAAAQKHVSAGQADSGRVTAHAVGVAEHHAGAAQGIQVRRPDVRIAERGDGIGALVVGEKEHNVGRLRRRGEELRRAQSAALLEPRPAVDGCHQASS